MRSGVRGRKVRALSTGSCSSPCVLSLVQSVTIYEREAPLWSHTDQARLDPEHATPLRAAQAVVRKQRGTPAQAHPVANRLV